MNKGAELLGVYFQSLQDAAKRIGIGPSMLSLLLAGKRMPSIEVAAAIEREFKVPMASWVEETQADPAIGKSEDVSPEIGSATSKETADVLYREPQV